jgi:hypothetical protein
MEIARDIFALATTQSKIFTSASQENALSDTATTLLTKLPNECAASSSDPVALMQ